MEPFDVSAEFGRCHAADNCTMDPACMLFDNCEETVAEIAEEAEATARAWMFGE